MNAFHTPTIQVPPGPWIPNSRMIEAVPREPCSVRGLDESFAAYDGNPSGQATGSITYFHLTDACIAQIITGEFSEPYHEKVIADGGWIGFQFALSGEHVSVINGYGQKSFSGPRFSACANSHDLKVTKWYPANSRITYVNIIVQPEFLADQFGMDFDQLPQNVRSIVLDGEAGLFNATQSLQQDMIRAAEELADSQYTGKLRETYAKVKILELLCLAVEALTREAGPDSNALTLTERDIQLLKALRDDLQKNFADTQPLNAISRSLGLNRNKLSFGFKALFGCGVYEYRQQLRMQEACRLIREGRRSMIDIATSIGFQNQSSFSRAYKTHFGRPPSQDRGR